MIPHWVTDATAIAAPVVGLAYFILQLMMKNSMAETNSLLREHAGRDEVKHQAIDEHLSATDHRVDRIERKVYNGSA